MTECMTKSAEEAAAMIGVCRRTIYNWVRDGRAPNAGVGRGVLIPTAWVERQLRGPVGAGTQAREQGGY